MKFLFYSRRGDSLSLAQRVKVEGNDVYFYQDEVNVKSSNRVGDGIVPTIDSPHLDQDTVVVYDAPGNGVLADRLRKSGQLVVGGGMFNDALVKDSFYATQILKASRVRVADHDTQGIDSYVEGWFSGQEWVYHSINVALEEPHFLTGSLGPEVGSMGEVVFFYRHGRPMLAKNTLLRLSGVLRKVNYRGPISLRVKGDSVLRVFPGFRGCTLRTSTELLRTEIGKVLYEVARGNLWRFDVVYDFAVGVALTIPPFPYGNEETLADSGGSFVEVPEDVLESFHPGDVAFTNGTLHTAGNHGVVGFVTSVKPTVAEARRDVYEKVRRVKVKNAQYRLDIGERALKGVPTLLREVSSGD